MISEFLLKGIDNIFQDKLSISRTQNKNVFNRDNIKRDLSTVIRTKDTAASRTSVSPVKKIDILKNIHKEIKNQNQEDNELNKSRLKSYLQNDREKKINSVIRRSDAKSKSPIKSIPTVNYSQYDVEPVQYQNTTYVPPAFRYSVNQPSHSPLKHSEPYDYQPSQNQRQVRRPVKTPFQQFQNTSSNFQERRIAPSPNKLPGTYKMF